MKYFENIYDIATTVPLIILDEPWIIFFFVLIYLYPALMSQIIDEAYRDFAEKYSATYVLMQTFIFTVCSSLFFYKVKEFVFLGDYVNFADKASVFSIFFVLYISSFLTGEILTQNKDKVIPLDMT